MTTPDSGPVVLTVGHSTRPLAEFIALLKAHSVVRLMDVRTVPRSRHNPQFDRDALSAALAAHGIGYEHLAGLGGFRRTHPGSLDRKSTRLNSSHLGISYAVFCLKKKNKQQINIRYQICKHF